MFVERNYFKHKNFNTRVLLIKNLHGQINKLVRNLTEIYFLERKKKTNIKTIFKHKIVH